MERFLVWFYLALIVWAPLPLGSNRPLGWSFLALAVSVMLILYAIERLVQSRGLAVSWQAIRVPVVLLSLSAVWVVFQNLPLDLPYVSHPAWADLSVSLGIAVPGRIGLDPDRAFVALMLWLTYAGVFFLSVQLFRDRTRATTALDVFIAAATAYAVYGLAAESVWGQDDPLLGPQSLNGGISATFVNRNHFATFAALGLICAAAAFLYRSSRHSDRRRNWKQRLRTFLNESMTANLFYLVSSVILLSALLQSGSRAGVIAGTAGALVAVFLSILRKKGRSKSRYGVLLLIALVGVLGVFEFSGGFLKSRLLKIEGQERVEMVKQTWDAVEDHLWLGSGLGSFPQIFQLYRDEVEPDRRYVDKAHNIYLELLLELGLPVFVLFVAIFIWISWRSWVGATARSRDQHYGTIGLGVSAAIAIHSIFDFSIQIPAIAVTYAFLAGLSVTQSFTSRSDV